MGITAHAMFRDGQMRAAMDAEAQAHAAHARNNAWQGLRAPAGMTRVERYQTADPTLSLATVQDGRPVYDFAAAPSLFVEEDLRQEKHMLEHRKNTCELLKAAEVMEAKTVATRIDCENAAQAALAAARAAINRAHELRDMLSSAQSEQERASAERLRTSAEAEAAAKCARDCEALAVEARRAQDCAFAERRSLETKSYRQPVISSALGARGGYLMDH